MGNYAIIEFSRSPSIYQMDHARFSCGFIVRKDVPPYTKAAKNLVPHVGINSVILVQKDLLLKNKREIQIFTEYCTKNYNTSQAVSIEAEMGSNNRKRDEILDFIRNSSRGVYERLFGQLLIKIK